MSERPDTPPRGVQILREAAALLGEMTFGAIMGDAARGRWVSVLVVPGWGDDDTITVDISCRPAWPQSVDWDRLALWVRPTASADGGPAAAPSDLSVGLLPPLDERGYVSFSGLPASRYSIGVGERAARGLLVGPATRQPATQADAPPRAIRTRGAIFTRGEGPAAGPESREDAELQARVARRRAREGRGGEAEFPLSGLRVYRSPHRRVTATVLPGRETMEVAFETDDAELAGRPVRFTFLDAETGAATSTGEVTFRPVPGAGDLCEAVWHGPLVAGASDFLYELV